jgi:hypothetical protein
VSVMEYEAASRSYQAHDIDGSNNEDGATEGHEKYDCNEFMYSSVICVHVNIPSFDTFSVQ